MAEELPYVPIDQIPDPTSTNLSDATNIYPLLEQILVTDSVGPQAANRQPKAVDIRTETIRTNLNQLLEVVNAMSLNFLHRDGVLTQSAGLPAPSFMRGNLDMQDPTLPTQFQVKNTANGTEDLDAVTKQQADALQAQITALGVELANDFVLRNGSLPMLANMDMGGFQIENLASAINNADAVRKDDFDAIVTALENDHVARDGSQVLTGNLNMGGNKLTNLPVVAYPNLDGDAVPKKYVDDSLASIAAVPSGTVASYAGGSVPIGWILCDGRVLSTLTFPDLFNAVGYTYGGSGASFNVPDLRGRVAMGMDDFGGLSTEGPANRVTSAAADSVGGTLGTETHTLLEAELPAHTHSFSDNHFAFGSGGSLTGVLTPVFDANTLVTVANTTAAAGGGNPHNNMQPTMAMLQLIKT